MVAYRRKAKFKNTGKFVAIKVFEKHTDSEYDTVKLVLVCFEREIVLIKKNLMKFRVNSI